jgi:Protein of unknown function (DUF1353)
MKRRFPILIYALILLLSGIGQVTAADGRFIGDVVAKWQPNGRDMELTEAFTYVDGRGNQWAVPKVTVVDGASIPRALWSVVGSPFTGKYRKASVIHDYFCGSMSRPWQDVHQIFFQASLTEGNTLVHARLMYGTVYAWGPRWEMVDGKPVRTSRSGSRGMTHHFPISLHMRTRAFPEATRRPRSAWRSSSATRPTSTRESYRTQGTMRPIYRPH